MTYMTVVAADGRRYFTAESAREDWNAGRDFKVICVALDRSAGRDWHINKSEFEHEIEILIWLDHQSAYGSRLDEGSFGTFDVALLWNSHGDRR